MDVQAPWTSDLRLSTWTVRLLHPSIPACETKSCAISMRTSATPAAGPTITEAGLVRPSSAPGSRWLLSSGHRAARSSSPAEPPKAITSRSWDWRVTERAPGGVISCRRPSSIMRFSLRSRNWPGAGSRSSISSRMPGAPSTPHAVQQALRPDTLLVSIMHVNNETGVIQPIEEVAASLAGSDAFLHVDAAQSYGREITPLLNPRIDFISVSGHKIHAPKGIGALVARRRGGERPPSATGHVRRRAGARLASRDSAGPSHCRTGAGPHNWPWRNTKPGRPTVVTFVAGCSMAWRPLGPVLNGDSRRAVPHIVNLAIPGIDSEAAHRSLARSGGHIERRGLYVSELYLQPRSQRHGPAAMATGWRVAPFLVPLHPDARRRIDDRRDLSMPNDSVHYKRARFSTRLPGRSSIYRGALLAV